MKEKLLFQYLDLIQGHGSAFGQIGLYMPWRNFSIPWKLDFVVAIAVHVEYFEISVWVGMIGSNGSDSGTS